MIVVPCHLGPACSWLQTPHPRPFCSGTFRKHYLNYTKNSNRVTERGPQTPADFRGLVSSALPWWSLLCSHLHSLSCFCQEKRWLPEAVSKQKGSWKLLARILLSLSPRCLLLASLFFSLPSLLLTPFSSHSPRVF